MPRLRIPPPYRGPTRGRDQLDVEGRTVQECLEAAEALYPGFLPQVLDGEGRVHRFVQLFVNGEEIGRGALDTRVEPDDRIDVLAAIGGG